MKRTIKALLHLYFFCLQGALTKLTTIPETKILCKAVSSLAQRNYLSSPLNIRLFKSFECHVEFNTWSVVMNYCVNETMDKSTVIFLSDTKLLKDEDVNCMNHQNNHLIVLSNQSYAALEEVVKILWRKLLIKVSFLLIQNSTAVLQTFMPYNEKNCNDLKLRTINEFAAKTGWRTDQFFPNKVKNFHRCPIRITTYRNVVPYIIRDEIVNGKMILKGRVIEIVNALSKSLNFTAQMLYEPSISAWESCFQKVATHEADIFIGNTFLELPRTKYLDYTTPIFFEYLRFVVPPGRYLSEIENLFRTFDLPTYVLTFVVFAIAVATVLVISFKSRAVKMYAFGHKFHNAGMDLLGSILGNTQTSMPVNSIPRFIIMLFVLFNLILRTLYQGSLFTFLRSDGKLKEVQSVDEMIERKFTFFMLKQYLDYLHSSEHKHIKY